VIGDSSQIIVKDCVMLSRFIAGIQSELKGATLKIKPLLALPILLSLMLPISVMSQSGAWAPTKNVEIIAPAGPGSALDQTARTIQRAIQVDKLIEASTTVVNRAGGGQALGFNYLNQNQGNGHYLAIGTISLLTNRITGINPLNYEDITPVANLVGEYIVFAVRTESSLATGKDVATRLKADPTALSVAFSGSLGNHNHMAIGLLGQAVGSDVRKLKTVVFASGGELSTALLGGHVDIAAGGSSVFAGHVQAGRMRLLAVTSPKRLTGNLASIPTWSELGFPVSFATFRGVVGPKAMPQESVRYLETVMTKVSASNEWKKFLETSNSESLFMGSGDFRKYLASENARISVVLRDLGLAK
jgi:putative tricarboxylic transport membrane protein